jgi:hypothetical protein
MYPICADQKLGLCEIADHWAGELGQPNRYRQLLQNLIKSWWAGEFGPIEAQRRLPMLKLLYKYHRKDMTFLIPGDVEPETSRELPDGGAVVDISYRICLPDQDPNAWTQENCAGAFKELADRWTLHLIPQATDGLALLKISGAEFTAYVRARGYYRPKFWAEGKNPCDSVLTAVPPTVALNDVRVGDPGAQQGALSQDLVEAGPSDRASPIPLRQPSAPKRRGKPPTVFDRVVAEMRKKILENRTTPDGLWETKEMTSALDYGCSRDTVRRARTKVAPRNVEN